MRIIRELAYSAARRDHDKVSRECDEDLLKDEGTHAEGSDIR